MLIMLYSNIHAKQITNIDKIYSKSLLTAGKITLSFIRLEVFVRILFENYAAPRYKNYRNSSSVHPWSFKLSRTAQLISSLIYTSLKKLRYVI